MPKVFVLTHCAAEENYSPSVFTDFDKAKKAMHDSVDDLVFEQHDDESGEQHDYVESYNVTDVSAEVIYTDDTYDVFRIFEVEVK